MRPQLPLPQVQVRTCTWFAAGKSYVAITGAPAAYSGVTTTKRSSTRNGNVTVVWPPEPLSDQGAEHR